MINMENKKTGMIVFVVLIVVAVFLSLIRGWSRPSAVDNPISKSLLERSEKKLGIFSGNEDLKEYHNPGQAYIARLHIKGTIQEESEHYNQKWLISTIDDLQYDEDNVGIILDVDSPGGTVFEADEAYLRLLEYAEEKPVYAYLESLAASGGYYISCAASHITANRNTLTGSIGVIAGQSVDLTGLMEKYGVKVETFHSGRNKVMGNYSEPLTDEQREIMQSISDECYEQFVGIVAKSRKMKIDAVKELADGRVYTANQAKKNGLVDAIGTWDEALTYMENECFDGEEIFVEDFEYEPEMNFYRYFMGARMKSAVEVLPEAVEKVVNPKLKYPAFIWEQ